jgi:hypothetical protein
MLRFGKFIRLKWCLLRSRSILCDCTVTCVSSVDLSNLFPLQRRNIEGPGHKGYYEYDLRQKDTSTPCPYDFFDEYLNSEPVRKAIGAEVPFVLSSDPVEAMFNTTGDVISSRCLRPVTDTESLAGRQIGLETTRKPCQLKLADSHLGRSRILLQQRRTDMENHWQAGDADIKCVYPHD